RCKQSRSKTRRDVLGVPVRLAPVASLLNTEDHARTQRAANRTRNPQGRSLNLPELDGELWRDIYYASFDDLRLYVRHYPAPDEKARAVICLPGLTRNSKDFQTLAAYLAKHPDKPRNVYCFDYRGRGRSQY